MIKTTTIVKKSVIWTSIACIVIAALLAILLVFGKIEISGGLGKIMLTLMTLGIGSLLSINSLSLLEKKFNIFAVISLVLLGISCLMALISFWINMRWGLYTKLTIAISVFSILFNIIVSYNIRLGMQKLVYQIVTYVLMAIFDIYIIIIIFNASLLNTAIVWQLFVVDIILCLVGLAILSIFTKKSIDVNNDGFVKIPKTEYQSMKARIAELEELLKNK